LGGALFELGAGLPGLLDDSFYVFDVARDLEIECDAGFRH
jgi:hypothetical protein